MASNFTVLPLTVPTVACNLSVKCTSSDKQCASSDEEDRSSVFEKSLHSKYHHETITFTRLIWMNTTLKDKFYYLLGLLSAIITGAVIPIININFGQMLDIYVQHDEYKHLLYDTPLNVSMNSNGDDLITLNQTIANKLQKFRNNSYNLSFTILAIGFVYFFLCYMFAVLLELVSTRIIQRLRLKFYSTLFTYDDLLTDCVTTIDFASRMEENICQFEKWIGTPIGLLFYMISSAIFSLISAIYHGWELTFILISLLPLLIVTRMYIGNKFCKLNSLSNEITYKTEIFITCIIDYIRLILSYNISTNQEMKFNNLLYKELIINRKKIILNSLITAFLWFISYATFAIGIWYAAKFIIIARDTTTTDDDNVYTVGRMIIIFWNVLSITYFVIRIKCYLHQFNNVPFHASTLVNFIERQSHNHEKGLRPVSFIPTIKFINVSFNFQLNSGCNGCSNESNCYLISTANEKTFTSSVISPFGDGNSTSSSHVRFKLPNVSTNYCHDEKSTCEQTTLCLSSLSESLYNVSFSIDQGETLCILGEEGSGTSVIGKLLYQFFVLDGGKNCGDILLGDNSLSTLNREWVKSTIGYIASDAVIYDASIRENVWIADKSSTEDEVTRACDDANIGKFIQSLPQSYETKIGRRGLYLKPSEIIRLSIARALVKRAKILIFDRIFETINDPEQLSQVIYAVEKARIKCTSIIITSKITKCVKNSNQIVLLSDGKIIEKGSHDQLLQQKGLYKQIFVNQIVHSELTSQFMGKCRETSSFDENFDRKSSKHSSTDEIVNQSVDSVDKMCSQAVDAIINDVVQHPHEMSTRIKVTQQEVTIYVSDEDNITHVMNETPVESDEMKVRSSSVLSGTSTVTSDCTSDVGEKAFYREQKTRSMLKSKYSNDYTLYHLIQYFDFNDWLLLCIGSLTSITFGLGLPMYALIAGELLSILEYKTADGILQEAGYISLQFIILSLIISISSFISSFTFGYFEASFTCKLKRELFNRIISFNFNWIQSNESSIHPPLMKSLFTQDINKIPRLMTSLISSYSTLTGTLILCIGYSFYTHWQLALIAVSLMPLIIFRYSWMGRSSELQLKSHAHDKKISVYRIIQTVRNKYKLDCKKNEQEILSNVDLNGLINKINEKYESIINNQSLTQQSDVHIRSQVIAAIQCIPILAYGIVYLFATYFIQSNTIHYTELFKIIEAVIFGSILVSEGSFFTYEMQSIKHTAQLMSHLLNSFVTYKPSDVLSCNPDELNQQNDSLAPSSHQKSLSVKLQNVSFRLNQYSYKSILSNFTYSFQGNSFTAIYCISNDSTMFPSSGSIILSLIQKLIYPNSGIILIDNRNIASVDSEHVRKQTVLITSNSLFLPNCSISENIALGDINRFVSQEEIIDICRQIGLHRKIQCLPHGYNSKLLSIQHELSPLDRVLIMFARAIVQNASIILLEHIDHGICEQSYMSLIDPVIQRLRNRGKIIIDLPTNLTLHAKAYDSIVLIDENGCILETGSHEHLISQDNLYTRLYHLHAQD